RYRGRPAALVDVGDPAQVEPGRSGDRLRLPARVRDRGAQRLPVERVRVAAREVRPVHLIRAGSDGVVDQAADLPEIAHGDVDRVRGGVADDVLARLRVARREG